MNSFVFSIYVEKLKKAWRGGISDMDLIELLYGIIAIPIQLKDKNDEIIGCSKSTASDIMNRKANVHRKIKAHSQDEAVKAGIVNEFKTQVVKKLLSSMVAGLIEELKNEIKESDILESRKKELLALAKADTLAEFLAETYLESLIPDNKIVEAPEENESEAQESHEFKSHPLEPIETPKGITKQEQPYVYALLKAYSDAENGAEITLELLDSYPTYKKHLRRQRDDYFAAEAVRRGTRDFYSESDPDQFQVLKDEIYDGIIDIFEDDWDNGLIRVRKVLIQASKVTVARCWLSRDTDWIGNAQKKGVCHILINDGRITGWRDEDV